VRARRARRGLIGSNTPGLGVHGCPGELRSIKLVLHFKDGRLRVIRFRVANHHINVLLVRRERG
jgi:hypothetical protein